MPPGGANPPALQLLWRLQQSERLSAPELEALQRKALEPLLAHAYATTRFYHRHWPGVDDFAKLPPLRRRDLQENYDELRSDAIPPSHGPVTEGRTSGSSGMPVRVQKTGLIALYWRAITLRDHAWHKRDLRGKLAVIRRHAGGKRGDNWGNATRGLATGPAVGFDPGEPIDKQLDWLVREKPDYLLTYPSLAGELARRAIEQRVQLPSLKGVRTLGELLPPEVRELCREAWGLGVTDTYSCEELGYLALQCPEHEHYHVQSESVLVEVVDDDGRPCRPGEVGRILATALHNYATPLVRYEVGDFAEVGEPCPCGRGLPVLRRIVGRTRNMFVTASGERFWPSFSSRSLSNVAPVVQHQFVQKTHDLLEARLVTRSPLNAEQEDSLRGLILRHFPPGVRMTFTYLDKLERGAGGKFEDFRSEIA